MDLGEALKFCYYNKQDNSFIVDSERMTEDDIGYYKLYVNAFEVRLGQRHEYKRKFYLQIKPKEG